MGWTIYLQIDLEVRRVGHVEDASEISAAVSLANHGISSSACVMAIRDDLPPPNPRERLEQVDPNFKFNGEEARKRYHAKLMYSALTGGR